MHCLTQCQAPHCGASAPDYCVPSGEIPKLIQELSVTSIGRVARKTIDPKIKAEAQIAGGEIQGESLNDQLGKRSTFTCPECHGALWQMDDKSILRFRCHIGHAYTAESLSVDHAQAVQQAMSIAIRTLEDSATLAAKLAKETKEQGRLFSQKLFLARAAPIPQPTFRSAHRIDPDFAITPHGPRVHAISLLRTSRQPRFSA